MLGKEMVSLSHCLEAYRCILGLLICGATCFDIGVVPYKLSLNVFYYSFVFIYYFFSYFNLAGFEIKRLKRSYL